MTTPSKPISYDHLRCYKQLPIWTSQTLPDAFKQKHNTKEGVWARLTILNGSLDFAFLSEAGETLSSHTFTPQNQPPFVAPQAWHRIVSSSEDLQCQLAFYCEPQNYYTHKYGLTATHSEVLEAANRIAPCKTLDLGCGSGRNALYLNSLGFDVTALDCNADAIARLAGITSQEQLSGLATGVYDINEAALNSQYGFILSTVVLMFLQRERIPAIIANMHAHTSPGGYNLIVCAMDTPDYPCTVPFTFTFKPDELRSYYNGWQLLKYNENPGHLHKTDAQGNRIALRFATILARKPL